MQLELTELAVMAALDLFVDLHPAVRTDRLDQVLEPRIAERAPAKIELLCGLGLMRTLERGEAAAKNSQISISQAPRGLRREQETNPQAPERVLTTSSPQTANRVQRAGEDNATCMYAPARRTYPPEVRRPSRSRDRRAAAASEPRRHPRRAHRPEEVHQRDVHRS